MATHSSILAWRFPPTEDSGGYSPRGGKESDMTEWLTYSASSSFPYGPCSIVPKVVLNFYLLL